MMEVRGILLSFIFVSVLLQPAVSEPVCSKFAYEEQLLEKMVRVEFNVEQMEREIQKTNSLVMESLEQLKFNWDTVSEESKILKTDIKKVLADTEERVSTAIDDLTAEREKTLKEFDKKMTQLAAAVSVPNIAFKAKAPSPLDPEENEVIIFTKNIVNIGNAYDNTTGIFTAPFDGTYLFTSQLCLDPAKSISYGIYIEDMLYTVGRFYEKNYCTCFNVETTAVMLAHQRASVKIWSASPGSILYEDGIHRWCLFSGTLIHR